MKPAFSLLPWLPLALCPALLAHCGGATGLGSEKAGGGGSQAQANTRATSGNEAAGAMDSPAMLAATPEATSADTSSSTVEADQNLVLSTRARVGQPQEASSADTSPPAAEAAPCTAPLTECGEPCFLAGSMEKACLNFVGMLSRASLCDGFYFVGYTIGASSAFVVYRASDGSMIGAGQGDDEADFCNGTSTSITYGEVPDASKLSCTELKCP